MKIVIGWTSKSTWDGIATNRKGVSHFREGIVLIACEMQEGHADWTLPLDTSPAMPDIPLRSTLQQIKDFR